MVKKICFVVAMGFIAFSCKQEPAYTISGTIDMPGMEGNKAYLMIGGWSTDNPQMDSALIANGKYEFKGKVAEPECGRIFIRNAADAQKSVHIPLSLENARIAVQTDANGWSIVSGTVNNGTYQNMMESKRLPEKKLNQAYNALREGREAGTLSPEEETRLSAERNKYYEERNSLMYNFVRENINNPACWNDVRNCAALATLDEQKALIANANERTLRVPAVKEVQERVARLEQTAVGQPFTDLRMSTPDGKTVALSDFAGNGKYVLVDFWASWCGPCRAEMPNVVAAYNKYKAKGFDIVGVSFDSNRDRWVKALDELQMPWHQMSDLKGWDSDGAKLYGISGIPHTLLLDPEGKIIARGLHGESLQQKLAEIFD